MDRKSLFFRALLIGALLGAVSFIVRPLKPVERLAAYGVESIVTIKPQIKPVQNLVLLEFFAGL